MDMDPNDILSTNVYIPKPNLQPSLSKDSAEEFRRYYEQEMKIESESKVRSELRSLTHSETHDDNNIINTQNFNTVGKSNKNIDRFTREKKTLVSVDSRDRMKAIHPKPNNFKIFLGQTFTNVKKIELVGLEFPNTDAVINSNNNRIYWRNQEDIDLDITVTTKGVVNYPIYSVQLRIGSYTASTLQTEIISKLNLVRRKQGTFKGSLVTGDYHYFVVSLDVDTDIVTFTSLILFQLPNNPFATSLGSGVITVTAQGHGYSTYDNIYITGTKAVAGIATPVLNGFHQITVVNANTFTFEITTKAGDTTNGGGNTVKSGKKAPFQMLWGERVSTVAQNIGYPLENSSEPINTNIASLENLFQMTINSVQPHGFAKNYDYIGQLISVGYNLSSSFITYKTFQVIDVPGTNSILVQVNDNTVADSLNNNSQAILLRFGSNTLDIASFDTYNISSIFVTTQTEHNYTVSDVGNTITISNTADATVFNDTSYDGDYVITSIPSNTSFVIPGVIGTINVHSSGLYGTIPRKTPLSTWTVTITNIQGNYIDSHYTKITTNTDHKLQVGDYVFINNVQSNPVMVKSYQVTSIPNSTSFVIQIELFSVDMGSINLGQAYVGTGLLRLSYPSHGFNTIINISNGIAYNNLLNISIQPIIIQTLTDHSLQDGDLIRLSGTNTIPNLDGGGYIVTVISSDTFSIIRTPVSFSPLSNIPTTVTGILGITNQFYLYGSTDIGGISKSLINNVLLSVREVIDKNTFTCMLDNTYATSTEIGGGSSFFISSFIHGFNGVQTNTKNSLLNRAINLQGENYCFLTCPQLNTMLNTGHVENIFARISLDQPPGYVCFKYLSNPKQFNNVPLDKLSELEFSVVNYDNSLYQFSDQDFSYCLEITEVSDATNAFNVSSRRGITDTS